MPGPTERDLLKRAAAGDEEAFVTIYRRYQRSVYRFALNMSENATLAEEATQEVFIALARDGAGYDPDRGSLAAYLLGMARNHVRRLNRGRERETDTDEAAGDVADASPDALSLMTRQETIEAVRRAISLLPATFREVVLLCEIEELSYEEAANALGCAVGTIRSKLHRGRALLMRKLREGNGDTVQAVRTLV